MTALYNATLYRIPDLARECGVSVTTVRNCYARGIIASAYYMYGTGAPLFTERQVCIYKANNTFARRKSGRPPRAGRAD